MQNFQNLENCNQIKNHYAEVLFSLYSDVKLEWTKKYHAIAYKDQTKKNYIRFTGDYNEETRSSSLQVLSGQNNGELFPKGTAIFAAYLDYKTQKVSDTAIMFIYGKPDEYFLIKKEKNHFTTQKFNGLVCEDEITRQYNNGGGSGFITGFEANAVERSKAEHFQKYSLVALMKKEAFATGRNLGQHSTSDKKKAAVIANGRKVAIRYKAEIDWAGGYKEIEFESGVECFKYFSGANGRDKIFNNYKAFQRAIAKGNGKFEYSTDKMSVIICTFGVHPTSKIYTNMDSNINSDNNIEKTNFPYLTSRVDTTKDNNKKDEADFPYLTSRVITQKDDNEKQQQPKPRGLKAKMIKDEKNYDKAVLSLSDDIAKQLLEENNNEKRRKQEYEKWQKWCADLNSDPEACWTFEEWLNIKKAA